MAKILELNLIRNRINIIETRRKYARYSRIVYFLAAFAFLVIVSNFLVALVKASSVEKKVAVLQSGITEKRKAFGLQDIEKQWQNYRWKLSAVDAMMKAHSMWGNRLKEFSNNLPDGMCISEIVVLEEKGKTNCNLEIMVVQEEGKGFREIDAFVNATESNKLFGKGVKLLSHERRQMNNKEIEVFQISLTLGSKESLPSGAKESLPSGAKE